MANQTSQELLEQALSINSNVEPIVLNTWRDRGNSQRAIEARKAREYRQAQTAVREFDKIDHDDVLVAAFCAHFKDAIAPVEKVNALIEAVKKAQAETAAANRRIAQLESEANNLRPFKTRALTAESGLRDLRKDMEAIVGFVEAEYDDDIETIMAERVNTLRAEQIELSQSFSSVDGELSDADRVLKAAKRNRRNGAKK